jgi:hypothetical protein
MLDSTAPSAAAESAWSDFPHDLQDFRNSTYKLDIIVIMVEIDPAACRRWLIPEDHS